MSTTLTNGLKLPDKGSVDWYADMQNNYTILDGAVGTIAEHTTALSGKAPLAHTHTKSDITDFPAYGTTAGTICEGNDSRLSDARTPVAHTHGKADITDLFNSANKWTQINTYTVALRFSAANYSAGTPSSDIFYGSLQWGGIVNNTFVQSFGINNAIRTNGVNDISLRVWPQTGSTLRGVAVETNADASNSSLRPLVNNVTDLGSTVYQWNNLYAKNYYYNGTAWGLDQNNTWTGANTFTSVLKQRINSIYSQAPTTDRFAVHEFLGTDDNRIFTVNCADRSSGQREMSLIVYDTDGTFQASGLFKESDNSFSFRPRNNNTVNLGNSSYKWKTLNGCNPGALSLPDTAREEPIDTTNWVYTYSSANAYYPPEDGWLAVACAGSDYIQIDIVNGWGITLSKGYDGFCTGIIPVKKNVKVQIRIKETSSGSVVVRRASFYPGTGDPLFTVTPLNNS